MNIAFLASYNGTVAKAVAKACLDKTLLAAPTLLISNNQDAGALRWAKDLRLKTAVINAKNSQDPDVAIAGLLEDNAIDLVLCSGYMKLIGPQTIGAVKTILNFHPALLPKHGGKGMYGRHVHQAVFDNQESETGITIHLVDGEYDHGKIIAQKRLPVLSGESVDEIEEKVKAAESAFLIETLQKILSGELSLR